MCVTAHIVLLLTEANTECHQNVDRVAQKDEITLSVGAASLGAFSWNS